MKPDDCEQCFYCDMPLGGFHEHDHAPIAKRHGGEDTVPTCVNCHNLKDRLPARKWPVELMVQALKECGPMGRIFLAKAFWIAADMDEAAEYRAARRAS